MREKHREDRLIQAGSSHNGIPSTMDTDREKSRFSSPVPSANVQRICTRIHRATSLTAHNFFLAKLSSFIHRVITLLPNFQRILAVILVIKISIIITFLKLAEEKGLYNCMRGLDA